MTTIALNPNRPITTLERPHPFALIIDTWVDAEGRTNGAIRHPEDIPMFEERMSLHGADTTRIGSKPDWDRHRELKFRLIDGAIYFTDVAMIGGRRTGMDGMWYVADRTPRWATYVWEEAAVQYHGKEQPNLEGIPDQYRSVNTAFCPQCHCNGWDCAHDYPAYP